MRIRMAISAHLKIVFVVHMNYKEMQRPVSNDNARHLFIIDNFLRVSSAERHFVCIFRF